MKTPDSLNSFMNIVKNKHPQVLPLITSKNEYCVEIEIPHDSGKTFAEQSEFLDPLMTPSKDIPVGQTFVSFSEKQECFKIVVNLK